MAPVRVAFEVGSKRTFASALDWPGWSRAAKSQEEAIQALIDYAPRYSKVAEQAGVPFSVRPRNFEAVEHLEGNATTDYGAPGAAAALEATPMADAEVERMCALVDACWKELDRIAKGAPAVLRKGPRGGGRDRDRILLHVLEAESGYAPKLALRLPTPAIGDRKAIAANRRMLLEKFRAGADGKPQREGGWSARYMARRIAWHAMDHAWEIEDRSES